METRLDEDRIEALIANRFPGIRLHTVRIPAGLGDRRFYRLSLDASLSTRSDQAEIPETLIARVEPKPVGRPAPKTPFTWQSEPSIEPIRTLFEQAGLPVPRSYVHDSELGIDILEDVGSRTLANTHDEDQRQRYLEASALIPRIQALRDSSVPTPAFRRFMDVDLIRTKAAKLVHWSFPGLLGREATEQERASIESGFNAISELVFRASRKLSHRDFKAENLLLKCSGMGAEPERLIMIDVQGAFMAPPEYDLVCLVRDMQVELPEALVEEVREASLANLATATAREESRERFEALSVVRLAKDISHVVDAARSRGDTRRWHEIPNGLRLLDNAAHQLERTFPLARDLSFVIHALTQAAQTADILSQQGADTKLMSGGASKE